MKKEDIKGEIRLIPIPAYAAVASDGYQSNIVGYFTEPTAAQLKAKKEGYGDGEVRPITVYTTDGVTIYELKPLGKLIDLDELQTKKMLDDIKAKITPAEWAFLQKHSKDKML
jgi:hypothetical protein